MSPPLALYDPQALRVLEVRATTLAGGDAFGLMRRAGAAGWRCVLQHWPQAQRIVVVCGPGNNGGDGYVLATHAQLAGRAVRVLHLPAHAPRSELARRACDHYLAAGGRIDVASTTSLADADLVVDALFGIGLCDAPDAASSALIRAIGDASMPVLALDVPSGVDAGAGNVAGAAVRADCTLQFLAPHRGLVTGAALDHVGALQLDALLPDSDLPALHSAAAPSALALSPSMLRGLLPVRERDSHKGDNGHVLCVGGGPGHGGAILLCVRAALRAGAGLVSCATACRHVAPLLAVAPEAMVHAVESPPDLASLPASASVVAIGPGLGQDEWGQAMLAAVLPAGKPLVLDADALNLLASHPRPLPADAIVTPHPGEAARLLGCSVGDVQADRYAAAGALVARLRCVVVLKGAGTIVAAPDAIPRVIAAGNPGMATGGMGDLLTGVIAAMRAQGKEAFDAACIGALLHAAAGDAAAREGERGLLPSDLLPWLRRLANPRVDD